MLKQNLKLAIKNLIPPILLNILQRNNKYGFFGNYNSWDKAKKHSLGYESNLILEKVKNSLLKVKNGEAIYERDSVIFDKIQYSWPLLTCLLYISNNKNNINLIDFGGSLGSTYFQNKKFLNLKTISWNIIEQDNFVVCGKKYFEDNNLKFYFNIEECLKLETPNIILLSSVIQYIDEPFKLLNYILSFNFEYILFDRTPFFTNDNDDRITIQRINPSIYSASYPAWIFNSKKFIKIFSEKYSLIEEFESSDRCNLLDVIFKGFLFRRKYLDK